MLVRNFLAPLALVARTTRTLCALSSGQRGLVVVDGHNLAYRMYFGMPPMATKAGQPAGALLGFLNKVVSLHTDYPEHNLLVAFDAGPTFRNDLLSTYKGSRKKMPPDLRTQLAAIYEACDALGVPYVAAPNFEADDVVASACAAARAAGNYEEVVVVSSDKDLLQLVDDGAAGATSVSVYCDKKKVWFDEAAVREKHGVTPGQLVDYLALVGDASDDVPGVPGVGPKGAAKLLAEHGDLDSILAAAESTMKKSKRRESLRENAEEARLARQLITLRDDVPLDAGAALGARLPPAENQPDLRPFLQRWEMAQLERRLFSAPARAAARAAPADNVVPF